MRLIFRPLITWGCVGFDRKILCLCIAVTGSRCPPLDPSSAYLLANSTESAGVRNYLAMKACAFAPALALAA